MVTLRPNRPARGSASALRVGLPELRGSCPRRRRSWAACKRVERARSRDVQGGEAGPRSGRKRSGPRSSPVAAAATTPLRSDAMNYSDATDPRIAFIWHSPAAFGSHSSTNARIIQALHPVERDR
jgi:hypothetical protein